MKTIIQKTSITMLLATVMTVALMAQPQKRGPMAGQGNGRNAGDNQKCRLEQSLPDLTEDQISKLKALRVEQFESSQKFQNKMGEIRAKEKTLMNENPIDQKAVEKLIDEKTNLMNRQMKSNLAHKAAINGVLTRDQQVELKMMRAQRHHIGHQAGKCRNGCPNMGKGPGMHGSFPGKFDQKI